MNLEHVLAVTGMTGLYKLVVTRNNGLIIEDFDTGKRTFISIRKHQFTPLESIGIYTYTDMADIKDVLLKIDELEEGRPQHSDSGNVLHAYFRRVLPDFDENRVYLSDMKKLLRWHEFLKSRGLLTVEASDEEE